MTPKAPNPYLRTQILTATPEELRLMLYDGALKFCRQARQHLETQSLEESYNCLMRAQKIVLELSTSLDHRAAPELCQKLTALYTYIYRLLVDANMTRSTKNVDEAVRLLEFEKDTWQMLIRKLGASPQPASEAALAGAQQTAISSLSQSA
jgi:flagellar secretion chaperone FliS